MKRKKLTELSCVRFSWGGRERGGEGASCPSQGIFSPGGAGTRGGGGQPALATVS